MPSEDSAIIGRMSPYSLYDQNLVTFEEGAVSYDHRDAAGFIKLNALRLRTLARRARKFAGLTTIELAMQFLHGLGLRS
jgi:argininosuccinate synthase